MVEYDYQLPENVSGSKAAAVPGAQQVLAPTAAYSVAGEYLALGTPSSTEGVNAIFEKYVPDNGAPQTSQQTADYEYMESAGSPSMAANTADELPPLPEAQQVGDYEYMDAPAARTALAVLSLISLRCGLPCFSSHLALWL